MTIIRIDWDPTEINRIVKADIGICGDAKPVVAALADRLARKLDKREGRSNDIAGAKRRAGEAVQKLQPQLAYLEAIRSEMPDDGILVDEITQVGFASWLGFPVYNPRSLVTCGYQGTLGYGYATALGVKAGRPDKTVVALAGDGGFMFNVQELATAAQFGIGVVVIVFNNRKFGNVRRHQEEWYGGRFIGSELKNPKFAEMAETFGVAGYRANSPETLKPVLRKAIAEGAPALIEVEVGDMGSPWQFILRERIRGRRTRHQI
jgi:acetolactate synthase-1/2/3 large subunit